eukprot:scaffold1142_cov387-Prasinococcus_capsulatus_cf.AAC.11
MQGRERLSHSGSNLLCDASAPSCLLEQLRPASGRRKSFSANLAPLNALDRSDGFRTRSHSARDRAPCRLRARSGVDRKRAPRTHLRSFCRNGRRSPGLTCSITSMQRAKSKRTSARLSERASSSVRVGSGHGCLTELALPRASAMMASSAATQSLPSTMARLGIGNAFRTSGTTVLLAKMLHEDGSTPINAPIVLPSSFTA